MCTPRFDNVPTENGHTSKLAECSAVATLKKIADALVAGGADIVELGIPFSDPIADGPTLQRAAGRALEAGTTPRKVFDLARAIRGRTRCRWSL
jgi:tryptophan synthase alpha subunit